DEPGRHVVKFAPPEKLRRELDAWLSCRPHGLRHDLVFMALEPRRDGNELIGLVYGDAQQFLGVEAVPLESAFLDAVLHGSPTPASVADTFAQLSERIGPLLYPASRVDEPTDPGFLLDVLRLESSLKAWEAPDEDPARVRQDVNTWATTERGHFRDPVDYL